MEADGERGQRASSLHSSNLLVHHHWPLSQHPFSPCTCALCFVPKAIRRVDHSAMAANMSYQL